MFFRAGLNDSDPAVRHRGFAGAIDMRWFAWLNLIWVSFIILTPLGAGDAFPNWKWPTAISLTIFLWLYFRAFYRHECQDILWHALAIGALGFVVTPFNSGAQTYLIYACAFFAFTVSTQRAVLLMAGMLALYALEWFLLGFPWVYIISAMVIGPVIGCMNIFTRRKQQSDAALKLSHDEVRRLAALAERERIGRDLHDLLGHTLSLITLKSELANRLFERDPQAARREIAEVERVARDSLAQVRRAVTGIRAAGFAAELASAKLLLESNGIHFEYALADICLPLEIETPFAMTLREAATNAQRHARATRVRASLEIEGRRVVLTIDDNGRGGDIVPGNGLCGMRERLDGIGADLRIESIRGQGTRLHVSMPLPQSAVQESATASAVLRHA